MPSVQYVTATITAGSSNSNTINTNQLEVDSITTGSNTTGSTITFLVSIDGTTFVPLYNNASAEYSILSGSAPNAPARAYYVADDILDSFRSFKICLGTSASRINQVTDPAIFTVALINHR
jgi:hypothetical protein